MARLKPCPSTDHSKYIDPYDSTQGRLFVAMSFVSEGHSLLRMTRKRGREIPTLTSQKTLRWDGSPKSRFLVAVLLGMTRSFTVEIVLSTAVADTWRRTIPHFVRDGMVVGAEDKSRDVSLGMTKKIQICSEMGEKCVSSR